MNKYYIGSSDIANMIRVGKDAPNTHPTLDQAVAEASNRCIKNNETVIVVQIVAIVKPEAPPVRVIYLNEVL